MKDTGNLHANLIPVSRHVQHEHDPANVLALLNVNSVADEALSMNNLNHRE